MSSPGVADLTGFIRHARQPRQRIVTAPFQKFLAELRRPVLRADLPTVNVRRHKRFAGERPGGFNQLRHHACELRVHPRATQFVALQSIAAGDRRTRG